MMMRPRRRAAGRLLGGAALLAASAVGTGVVISTAPGVAHAASSAETAESTETAEPIGTLPVEDLVTPIESIVFPVEDIETETVKGDTTTIEITSDVLFATDSADLTDAAKDHLKSVADRLQGASGTVAVDGYTDSSGDETYNQKLSKERAQAVVDELKKQLPVLDFTATGHGENDPVAPNQTGGEDDPDAMAKNRRVTIEYS